MQTLINKYFNAKKENTKYKLYEKIESKFDELYNKAELGAIKKPTKKNIDKYDYYYYYENDIDLFIADHKPIKKIKKVENNDYTNSVNYNVYEVVSKKDKNKKITTFVSRTIDNEKIIKRGDKLFDNNTKPFIYFNVIEKKDVNKMFFEYINKYITPIYGKLKINYGKLDLESIYSNYRAPGSGIHMVLFDKFSSIRAIRPKRAIRQMPMFESNYIKLLNTNINNFCKKFDIGCVPESLHYYFGYYFKKWSVEDFKNELLKITNNIEYYENKIGFSTQNIIDFAKKYRISVYVLDSNEKLIEKYICENRNHNLKSLVYIFANEHLYLCDNLNFIKKIARTYSGNKMYTSELVEKSKKEDKELKLENCTISVCSDLKDELIKTINDFGIPKKVKIDNGKIRSYEVPRLTHNHIHTCNPNLELINKFINKYNSENKDQILFKNQSLIGIGLEFFNRKLPLHQKSVFNELAFKYFKACGQIKKDFNISNSKNKAISRDINKCYTSCIIDNILGKYKRFGLMDEIKEYNGEELSHGFYYISINNFFLGLSNLWCPNEFCEYLKNENISFDIIYEYKASNSYDEDYLKELFEYITTYDFGSNDFKFVANSLIGCFAKTKNTISSVKFDTSYERICHMFFEKECENNILGIDNVDIKKKLTDELYLTTLNLENDKKLYQLESRKSFDIIENDLPIYNQVLCNSYIKMYELYKKLGGRLISIHCDTLVVENPIEDVELSNKIGGYRVSDMITVTKINEIAKQRINIEFKEWNEKKEDFFYDEVKGKNNYEMEKIADYIIETNKGYLVEGRAGTAKSSLLRIIKEKVDKKCQALAPTNKAALLINGKTIHNFLGINEGNKVNNKMIANLKNFEYILIDEISMVGHSLLAFLQLAKLQNNELKFILFGDFRQLKPVCEEGYEYSNSDVIKFICDNNKIELHINKRSDDIMRKITDKAFERRSVNTSKFNNFNINKAKKHICRSNYVRRLVNKYCMLNQKGKGIEIPCTENDLEINKYAQRVLLVKGTPIMSCKNNKKAMIVNNEEFIVNKWDKEYIYFSNENKEDKIEIKNFNSNYVVSFAITVHRSQGQTFDFKYCIWEYEKFDKHMLYTALTRTTKKEYITIVTNEDPQCL